MRVKRVVGSVSILLGVVQLLAVPGYYHWESAVAALLVAALLVAFGYVVLPRTSPDVV